MKKHEKLITALFALLLFVCLYLTGQSVLRTAARYTGQLNRHAAEQSVDTFKASTVKAKEIDALGCSNTIAAINPVGNQRTSYPFPAAIRQITTYIMFSVLYLQSAY